MLMKIEWMSISWKKGNNEPISHLEDLMNEIVEDEKNYYVSINEQRLNGKIRTISMIANIVDEGE